MKSYSITRVRTDPGKSWNFIVQNSRPGKSWKKAQVLENPGKSWNSKAALILAATAARQKYSAYLNELHVKEANDAQSKKRKALQEDLEQLQTKKRRLQKEAEDLKKEADDLAAKAEHKHDFVCITKSNSSRKTAKQKLVDIQELNLHLESIQQQCGKSDK